MGKIIKKYNETTGVWEPILTPDVSITQVLENGDNISDTNVVVTNENYSSDDLENPATLDETLTVISDDISKLQRNVSWLAKHGTGGGGGSSSGLKRGRLQVTQYYGDKTQSPESWAPGEIDILNGDTNGFFTIYAESGSYDDNPIDDTMALTIEYYAMNSSGEYVLYDTDRDYTINHMSTIIYDYNDRLRDSTNHKIIIRIAGSEDNKFSTSSSTKNVNTHDLAIS